MKYVLDVILVFILYLIQSVFGQEMAIYGIQPDLLFLYLCYRALEFGPVHGSVLGFLIGLLQDIYSPVTLGANSLAKTLVGITLGRSGEAIYRYDLPLRLLAIFLALLGHDIVFFLFTDPRSLIFNFTHYTIFCGLYTVIVGGLLGFVHYLINKLLPA